MIHISFSILKVKQEESRRIRIPFSWHEKNTFLKLYMLEMRAHTHARTSIIIHFCVNKKSREEREEFNFSHSPLFHEQKCMIFSLSLRLFMLHAVYMWWKLRDRMIKKNVECLINFTLSHPPCLFIWLEFACVTFERNNSILLFIITGSLCMIVIAGIDTWVGIHWHEHNRLIQLTSFSTQSGKHILSGRMFPRRPGIFNFLMNSSACFDINFANYFERTTERNVMLLWLVYIKVSLNYEREWVRETLLACSRLMPCVEVNAK